MSGWTAAGATALALAVWRGAARLCAPPVRRHIGPVEPAATPSAPAATTGRRRRLVELAAIATTGLLGLAMTGPLTTTGLLAGAGAARRWARLRRQRHHQHRVQAELPDTIDVLVVLVRAGLTPVQAVPVLAERGPPTWRPAWSAVERARATGTRFVDALDQLPTIAGSAAHQVVDALSASERYGQPLAPVLERLSADGHAARRRLAEIEARQLPVRLSFPLVLCTMPAFVLLTIAPLLGGALSSLSLHGGAP